MRKRIMAVDPAVNNLGWAVIEIYDKNATRQNENERLNIISGFSCDNLEYIASGALKTPPKASLPQKLLHINSALSKVILQFKPQEFALEETFVNKNPLSSLKLCQARGAIILTASLAELPIFEYAPNTIKKSITGNGKAEKTQLEHMVKLLLPKAKPQTQDEADSIAIALCHIFKL